MKLAVLLSLLFLSTLVTPATAATHTIMFGPGYYSPSTLQVDVGDTVKWQADDSSTFAGHPLESYDFPAGAAPIYVNTGTTYSYVVAVEGTYKYRCQLHWTLGMLGEFSATEQHDTTSTDTRHVIMFGPGYYTPNWIHATIGDTLVWIADDSSSFTGFPLSSYLTPPGAELIAADSGTMYMYVATVPGHYKYSTSGDSAMMGSFTVSGPWTETKHVVMFGENYYSPANFTVDVGDTIIWMAESGITFGDYPLTSYDIPIGAAALNAPSGVMYEYAVTTPGTYKYWSQDFAVNGMTGEFTAIADTIPSNRHVIMFGPGYYSPANLTVEVGDVIVWQADDTSSFAQHPLESYDFPAGAAPIYVNSGTIYEYLVTVPGTYKYRCQLHWTIGMLGEFTAIGDTIPSNRHVIMFGPGYYSPANLTVEVGDVIVWQADDSSSFAQHPLESYDFPAGAAPIYVNSGTIYEYLVTVPGTYKYRCQLHWTVGMLGEFTAVDEDTSGVRHVIMFGPGYYSPANLQVEVGDVVVWQADDSSSFAQHPLESYDFPAGAAPIYVNTGTTYEYTVTVPGTYKYRCQLHWTQGMLGQFTTEDNPPDTSLNKHIIVFDSFFYSPALISDVVVGDTIEWRGDFVVHPLISVIIPPGAASFSNSSGTVFQYVVTTEGVYTYACAHHGLSHGMVGSFITVGAGVNDPGGLANFKTLQAYPNPVSTLVRIPFETEIGGELLLTFHDITGREVRRAIKPVVTGRQELEADLSALPSGMYTYRLMLGQTAVTGQVVVAR